MLLSYFLMEWNMCIKKNKKLLRVGSFAFFNRGPEAVLSKPKQEEYKSTPILKYPGYVESRHPALRPSNPKDPPRKVKKAKRCQLSCQSKK